MIHIIKYPKNICKVFCTNSSSVYNLCCEIASKANEIKYPSDHDIAKEFGINAITAYYTNGDLKFSLSDDDSLNVTLPKKNHKSYIVKLEYDPKTMVIQKYYQVYSINELRLKLYEEEQDTRQMRIDTSFDPEVDWVDAPLIKTDPDYEGKLFLCRIVCNGVPQYKIAKLTQDDWELQDTDSKNNYLKYHINKVKLIQ